MKDELQSGTSIEFGPFTFEKALGKLSKHGAPLRLRGMPLKILTQLVERPGEVVSRVELQRLLWNGAGYGDFEQGLNSAVNVVRKTLSDSADRPRYIETVPGSGYRFIAPLRSAAVVQGTPTSSFPGQERSGAAPTPDEPQLDGTWARRRGLSAVVLALLLTAGFLAWRMERGSLERSASTEPLRALPLSTLPGVHRYPSLSPDGNYLAFTWARSTNDSARIYVRQIGSGSPLQLTRGPGDDYSPVWSPDGRFIAFLRRSQRAVSELRLIAPLGGQERKLADVRPRMPLLPVSAAWYPDSKYIVVTDSTGEGKPDALFSYSLETGEKRQLTHPPASAAGDTSPAIAPNGDSIVFRRDAAPYTGELYMLRVGHSPTGLTASGEPRRLTPFVLDAGTPTFLPGGEEILFSAKGGLWRMRVSLEGRQGAPTRLPLVGEDGIMPVVSRPETGPRRLIYVRSFADWNIWRVGTPAPGGKASSPPAVAITSTKVEWMPEFSPDGRRVTFVSNRSGESEIWVADPDGSNASQITSMGANPGAPRWSPDGDFIAFHSNPEGQATIYVVPVAGGKPRNVTFPPADGGFPSFSRNGRWMYFTSKRDGELHIWKTPVTGSGVVQVTKTVGPEASDHLRGGDVARESPDGAYLYYVQTIKGPSGLWRMPVSGGEPVKVVDGVVSANFVVLGRGIYYVDRPAGETRLQFFDLAARKSKTVVSSLGTVFLASLTASADGRIILYARLDSSIDDVMLVENFR